MQKKKRLKTSKIMMMVCALMLVFGAVVAVNNGVEASSILDTKVTFLPGDGPKETEVQGIPEEKDYSQGEKITFTAPTCTNSDFEFLYWVQIKDDAVVGTDKYGTGDGLKNEFEIPVGDNQPITFKAVWGVKVTYDKNLDDATENITVPQAAIAPYKTDFSIEEKLEATNYEFLGWSTEAKKADATPEYKYGDVIKADMVTGGIKLYAIWKAKFLRVTYHANTGSDATDSSVTVPVDSTKYMGENLTATVMGDGKLAADNANAATMKDATPVRTGYTFAGWATTATATTAEYKAGDKITMTKDMDLYAVWTSGTAATTGTTSGSGTTTTTKTPQTGDNDYLYLYIVMAALSLVGIAYLCYDQKKAKASK